MRHSQPVVDHAETHQQMLTFADALRQVPGGFESADRSVWIFPRQRLLSEKEIGAYKLRQYQAFPSLPRLKLSGEQYRQCVLRPSDLAIERREFYGKVIRRCHPLPPLLQTDKPEFRKLPGSLQQLVLLIQDAGIGRRAFTSTGKRLSRLLFIVSDVVIRKAKVAPGCWKLTIKLRGSLPYLDCLFVTTLIV